MHSIGQKKPRGLESGGKRLASAFARQRTRQERKTLKRVQFAEPITTCGQFTGGYGRVGNSKDLQSIRKTTFATAGAFSQPGGRNVAQSIATSVTRAVKRIGAIQVFRPRPSRIEDLATGAYRMSRNIDSFSFTQNPYFGRL